MKRRNFLVLAIGGCTVLCGASAGAQRSNRLPVIGFLGVNPAMWEPWTRAFVDRLNALGWIQGKTVAIEYRWAQGRPELYGEFAREFVELEAAVIVTSGAAVPALMKVTSSVPIVFAIANDPVGAGMVKSLSQPGGNVTGISLQTLDLANKRFELFREAAPGFRRLAIMADANFDQALLELNAVKQIASNRNIETLPLEVRRSEDIAPAFERARSQEADALYVVINELLNANRATIVNSAEAARLPSIYGTRDWVRSGGLMSYGPNFASLFARSAEITDKILKGVKPTDIPVEQPTRFELVVNLKTAKAIDITIPEPLLVRTDDLVE